MEFSLPASYDTLLLRGRALFFIAMEQRTETVPYNGVLFNWVVLFFILAHVVFPYFPDEAPSLFGKSFFVPQVLLAGALVLLLILLVRDASYRARLRVLLQQPAVIFLLAGLAVIGVSTLLRQGIDAVSGVRLVSIGAAAAVFFASFFVTRMFAERLLTYLAYLTLAASLLGIVQFAAGAAGDMFAPAAYFGHADTVYYAVGFANFPSLFGLHLAVFLPLFWGLAVTRFHGKRLLWSAVFFVGVAALVLTFSRTAWLSALAAGALLLVWFLRRRYDRKFVLSSAAAALGIALLTLFLAFSPADIQKRFDLFDDTSSRSRYAFHIAAGDMLAQDTKTLFVGLGSQGFFDEWQTFRPPIENIDTREHLDPHSTILEVLVSGGAVGLGCYLLFLVFLSVSVFRHMRRHPHDVLPVLLLLGVLVVGLDLFHTNFYSKYLWILAGLTMSIVSLLLPASSGDGDEPSALLREAEANTHPV